MCNEYKNVDIITFIKAPPFITSKINARNT